MTAYAFRIEFSAFHISGSIQASLSTVRLKTYKSVPTKLTMRVLNSKPCADYDVYIELYAARGQVADRDTTSGEKLM